MTLKALLTSITSTEPGIWMTLHSNVNEVFHIFNGSKIYTSYITCVIDNSYQRVWERAGFFSALILKNLERTKLKGDIIFDSFKREGLEVFLRGGQKIGFLIGIRSDIDKSSLFWKKLFEKTLPLPNVTIQGKENDDYFVISMPISERPRQAMSNGMECFYLTHKTSDNTGEIDWGEEIRFYK
ncbi:MAG: hypothetical protein K2H47_11345 [Muribaculaceae bacterium]|nr:hypothetical protein [Muribaculaceae bacterium]